MLSTGKLICEDLLHGKSLRTEGNMTFSVGYTNGKPRKTLRFPECTHINLPGKCVFSVVNSGEYLVVHSKKKPINKTKTNCLPCVTQAINAGKRIVYREGRLPNN